MRLDETMPYPDGSELSRTVYAFFASLVYIKSASGISGSVRPADTK